MSQSTLERPKQDQTDIPGVYPRFDNIEDNQRRVHREDETNIVEHGDESFSAISSRRGHNQIGNHLDIDGSQLTESILSFFPASREWRSAWSVSDDLGYPIDLVRTIIEANPNIFEISPIEPCGVKLYRPRKK